MGLYIVFNKHGKIILKTSSIETAQFAAEKEDGWYYHII